MSVVVTGSHESSLVVSNAQSPVVVQAWLLGQAQCGLLQRTPGTAQESGGLPQFRR